MVESSPPASKETLKHIVMRLAAGYSYDEVAAQLQQAQPELRHVPSARREVVHESVGRDEGARAWRGDRGTGAATY